jgi:integrase
VWTDGKNARSRRVIPLDEETLRALGWRRKEQAEERLAAGPAWEDHDLIIATHVGRPVMPRSLDRALERLVEEAGLPRLTSHGLRHTAATHMVRGARDVGELRAVADVLGHSPDMLMKVYAHALPESMRAVADRIGQRNRTAEHPGVR